MKVLFYLGHPAHFHLFKNVITNLKRDGNEVAVVIKKKDVLEELLKEAGIEYVNILKEGRKDSKIAIVWGVFKREYRLWCLCRKAKPDIMVGTSAEIPSVGKMLHIPTVNVNEDDADVVPLYAKISYPDATIILVPDVCDCGKWNSKAIKYNSYHELAYLHPDNFTPDKKIVEKYFSANSPYFIIRFAKLKAHHDEGIKGIDSAIAERIVKMLLPHGRVYITSERELEPQFEPYRIHIAPIDMHHVMAFAELYIGDSQTMAAESGVLGVPFVRFNDFVGRIGYLRDLEDNYQLGFGIKTNEEEKLYSTIQMLLDMPNRAHVFQERRQKMLSEKIDAAKFMTEFIEGWPESKEK